MYTLYIDKPEDFICELSVKNASMKNASARIIIKSDDINLLFEGKIENGKCIVPIKRLKGLLDENVRGKMNLEVIVEDTFFSPWNDDFLTEEHTSIKVKVNETKQSTKPVIEVKVPIKTDKKVMNERKGVNIWLPIHEISKVCNRFNINKSNLKSKKNDFYQIIKEYFKVNPEFNPHKCTILEGLKHSLK